VLPRKEEENMAKIPKNHGQPWKPADDRQLKALAKGNTPTRVIGVKLGRTPASVAKHASELKVSLRPTNQSPYGSRKTR
jgi:hypothetical protein